MLRLLLFGFAAVAVFVLSNGADAQRSLRNDYERSGYSDGDRKKAVRSSERRAERRAERRRADRRERRADRRDLRDDRRDLRQDRRRLRDDRRDLREDRRRLREDRRDLRDDRRRLRRDRRDFREDRRSYRRDRYYRDERRAFRRGFRAGRRSNDRFFGSIWVGSGFGSPWGWGRYDPFWGFAYHRHYRPFNRRHGWGWGWPHQGHWGYRPYWWGRPQIHHHYWLPDYGAYHAPALHSGRVSVQPTAHTFGIRSGGAAPGASLLGTLAGGVVGGLVGAEIDGGRDRSEGAVIGAVTGAVLGNAVTQQTARGTYVIERSDGGAYSGRITDGQYGGPDHGRYIPPASAGRKERICLSYRYIEGSYRCTEWGFRD